MSGLGLVVLVAIIAAAAAGKGKPHEPSSSGSAAPERRVTAPSRPRSRSTSSVPHTTSCHESGTGGGTVAVGKDTSCPFAGEVLKAYAGVVGRKEPEAGRRQAIEAWSPVTHKQYAMRCLVTQDGEGGGRLVICRGGQNAVVTFPAISVTRVQAQPAPEEAEGAETEGGSAEGEGSSEEESSEGGAAEGEGSSEEDSSEGGGEGADEVGSPSHAGDQQFCAEHVCIGRFTEEDGNVAECRDGTFSHAGGIQGACSYHGGVLRE